MFYMMYVQIVQACWSMYRLRHFCCETVRRKTFICHTSSHTKLEISVEFTKSSVISVDLKNSVNISRSLPVSYHWYLLILSVTLHGSVHVNMNKNPKIFDFWTQNVDFQTKNVQNFTLLSKILKIFRISNFDSKISKIPIFGSEFPFSDLFILIRKWGFSDQIYWQLLIFWFYWQPTSFF